ncbi:pimeloyl-ACP methyl ester carboxylesterase [Bradyrhizobium ottawaense]
MHTFRVNGYDMAYLEVGEGHPLVCVHGTLGDFRTWYSVLGPLSKTHRVISVSLRHFFPEHWDAVGDDYKMAQHVADMIAFIEQVRPGPVDLMGHSRGGHIAFRVAQARPDLVRKLVLAEPGGDLDASLPVPEGTPAHPPLAARTARSVEMIRAGDIEAALQNFYEGIEGDGSWRRVPAAAKQQLRDNALTFLGQINEQRRPYTLSDAQAIRTPTLLIGGGATTGSLSVMWRVLAEHIAGARTAVIPNAGHWMFEQAPLEFGEVVSRFLAEVGAPSPRKRGEVKTSHLPNTHRHLDRRIQPVPDIDGRNREDQRCELALVEMLGGLIPDRIRYRVLAIGEARDGLGQRQRGALGVREIGRVAPSGHGEQALVGLAQLAGDLGMHVDTDAATVDLAGAQVHQFQELFRQTLLGQITEGLQDIHGLGEDHDRVIHAGVHLFRLHRSNCEGSGHTGLASSWA